MIISHAGWHFCQNPRKRGLHCVDEVCPALSSDKEQAKVPGARWPRAMAFGEFQRSDGVAAADLKAGLPRRTSSNTTPAVMSSRLINCASESNPK